MPTPLQEVSKRRWQSRDKEMPTVFPDMPNLRYLMAELCKKAKVKEFGFHSLRHYLASILIDSGKATLRDTQNFLGHQRATTTDLYLKGLRPENNPIVEILDGYSLSSENSKDDLEDQNDKANTRYQRGIKKCQNDFPGKIKAKNWMIKMPAKMIIILAPKY